MPSRLPLAVPSRPQKSAVEGVGAKTWLAMDGQSLCANFVKKSRLCVAQMLYSPMGKQRQTARRLTDYSPVMRKAAITLSLC